MNILFYDKIKEVIHMSFRRIKDLREDADLTQCEISRYLNLSQRSYCHYERGTRALTAEVLIAIADFHNVSIDYLLERSNNKKINK